MMLKVVTFATLLCAVFAAVCGKVPQEKLESQNEGQLWAVLVAGSAGYSNYRHQADVCHAFQDLVSHGVPVSNIIVMMYDDIAYNKDNPTPGIIVNQPNGPDVYHGISKDYTGDEVSSDNFIKVLLGDSKLEARGKKVLKSGPKDNVFIFYADHGGPGLVGFPKHILYATQLTDALKKMHKKRKYAKLVFYMEACESGSMFAGLLPNNISVYAATASTPYESSYGCFYDSSRQQFVGDEFSVNWLIDSDFGKAFGDETLQQQFLKVKEETQDSQPQQYGDLTIARLPLTQFMGSKVPPERKNNYTKCDSPIPSDEVPLDVMRRRIAAASADDKPRLQTEYEGMLRARHYLNETVRTLVQDLCAKGHCVFTNELLTAKSAPITRHLCLEKLIGTFDKHCFNISRHTHATRYLRVFGNIVESLADKNLDRKCKAVKRDLKSACHKHVNKDLFERII